MAKPTQHTKGALQRGLGMNPDDHTRVRQALYEIDVACPDNYEADYLQRLYSLWMRAHSAPVKEDRTGVGRISEFGGYLRHFTGGYGPAFMLSKRVFAKGVFAELAWFLRGETNIQALLDEDVHIWDEWADPYGELGPVYGAQWRGTADGPDQVHAMLLRYLNNPHDSGNIVSAWNVYDLDDMTLRPCHTLWQICMQNGRLDLMLYQRSADWLLGVPFNAACYTSLQILLAHVLGLEPGVFHHYFGDTHLYANQVEAAGEHLNRLGRPARAQMGVFSPVAAVTESPPRPRLEILNVPTLAEQPLTPDIFKQIKTSDFVLSSYNPEPAIKAPVAV